MNTYTVGLGMTLEDSYDVEIEADTFDLDEHGNLMFIKEDGVEPIKLISHRFWLAVEKLHEV